MATSFGEPIDNRNRPKEFKRINESSRTGSRPALLFAKLLAYDYIISYKYGKSNIATDVLSQQDHTASS